VAYEPTQQRLPIHNDCKAETRVFRRGRKPTTCYANHVRRLAGFTIQNFKLLTIEHKDSACEPQVFAGTGVRKHAPNSGTNDARPLSSGYPTKKVWEFTDN